MDDPSRPTILCVDDEPQVLASLALYLRRRYTLLTASSGADGIRLLRAHPEVAAVLSDMRMPGMDGATFLHAARSLVPDAPRMLLTGHAEIDAAIAAVNNGRIFCFLLKPSAPQTVMEAVAAAIRQHGLVTAERVLLEQTLKGAIRALSDVLALTHPAAFGHAARIKQLAGELAARLLPAQRWAVEVAAMLAPLGSVALPAEVADKLHDGRSLDDQEKAMVTRIPAVTEGLLANIPRLELVRAILTRLEGGAAAEPGLGAEQQASVERAAAILRVALDLDALDIQGRSPGEALAALSARPGRYDPELVAALEAIRCSHGSLRELREIPVAGLRVGMVIAADVRLASGALLVARGFEVSASLLERIRNLRAGSVVSPVRVFIATPRPLPDADPLLRRQP